MKVVKELNIRSFLFFLFMFQLLTASKAASQADTIPPYLTISLPVLYDNKELKNGDVIYASFQNSDSVSVYGEYVYNSSDIEGVIELTTNQEFIAETYKDSFEFSLYISQQSCTTIIASFDSISTSDQPEPRVDFLEFRSHQLEYEKYTACANEEKLNLLTDIPIDGLNIYTNDSIALDNSYNVLPSASLPGNYVLFVETNYCYANTTGDTLLVNILIDNRVDFVQDSLVLCSNYMDVDNDLSNYYVYEKGEVETFDSSLNSLGTSGYYILEPKLIESCNVADTIFIEVIEPPTISFETESNCKRTIVKLNTVERTSLDINWTNGTTGNTVELEESNFISVEVIDENGCIAYDSMFVEVVPLEIENLDYQFADADCWKDGQIVINQVATNYGALGLNYSLVNKLNNQVVQDFENIQGGLYQLELTNEDNCTAFFDEEITILQKCLEDYPVFSPNHDGLEDEYFIPYEGSVQILDRNGLLVQELDTPAYWDGTDREGNLLPMGNYLIVTDSGRPVNITIVR